MAGIYAASRRVGAFPDVSPSAASPLGPGRHRRARVLKTHQPASATAKETTPSLSRRRLPTAHEPASSPAPPPTADDSTLRVHDVFWRWD
ncbi:hypothetical protein VPH35_114872 [Triticum aestivum]